MANIRPFKAWRYKGLTNANTQQFLAPLFDVISENDRERLYDHPRNVVHVSVPKDIKEAKSSWSNWRKNGTVVQDPTPAYYLYKQVFKLKNTNEEFTRSGFIVLLEVSDWDEEVVLRHEATMPFSVGERLQLLKETEVMMSPTHGLYSDKEGILDTVLSANHYKKLIEFDSDHETWEELYAITDRSDIELITQFMDKKEIILADGHHRYQSSIDLRKANDHDLEGHNYHMMFLSRLQDPGLVILPTHRLLHCTEGFDFSNFIDGLETFFNIEEVPLPTQPSSQYEYGIVTPESSYLIRLKEGLTSKEIPWDFPEMIKELELTVLHYFLIECSFGVPGHLQSSSRLLTFDGNARTLISKVKSERNCIAVLCNPVRAETVQKVCSSGGTLPQKSTYFYPKLTSGLIFASINEQEFR